MKLIIVAGALAIVGAVAIGLYVVTRTGAVCPVQNEAFYDHFYAKTLEVTAIPKRPQPSRPMGPPLRRAS